MYPYLGFTLSVTQYGLNRLKVFQPSAGFAKAPQIGTVFTESRLLGAPLSAMLLNLFAYVQAVMAFVRSAPAL